MNVVADALRWVPDRFKRKVIGSTARQVMDNIRLGVSANLRDKNGNIAIGTDENGKLGPIPDLDRRATWTEIVLRVMGIGGTQSQLVVALFAEVGVKDKDELLALAEAGRRFRDEANNATLSPVDYGTLALDMVERVMRLDDGFAATVRQRLGMHGQAHDAPHVNGDG
jgi:hypothetical protein